MNQRWVERECAEPGREPSPNVGAGMVDVHRGKELVDRNHGASEVCGEKEPGGRQGQQVAVCTVAVIGHGEAVVVAPVGRLWKPAEIQEAEPAPRRGKPLEKAPRESSVKTTSSSKTAAMGTSRRTMSCQQYRWLSVHPISPYFSGCDHHGLEDSMRQGKSR